MKVRNVCISCVLLWFGGLASAPAWAQQLFFVTGVSREGVARLTGEDGEPRPLRPGSPVESGSISVEADGQLMMLEDSGVVVLVLGPAQLSVSEAQSGVEIDLASGRITITASGEELSGITVRMQVGDAVADFDVTAGRSYLVLEGATAEIAYQGAEGPIIYVDDEETSLEDGERLTLRDGSVETRALDGWLAQHDFAESWGETIGVSSATAARGNVERDLFRNIVQWDRRSGASYVSAKIRNDRFSPEIRQVVQTISTSQRQTSRGTEIRTQPFNAANEVPTLSPAALSVQNRNIADGVTVITLNSRAGALLTNTGSQGLGFRGPSRLAISGLLGGLRTIGPAGLGAQP